MRLLNTALVGLVLCGISGAEEPFAGEVTASALNLRAGPGDAYQTVVKVERGAKLVVLGKHANNSLWYQVGVPEGYEAWISAELVTKTAGGMGEMKANRILLRPRPSTRYHQLSGRLNKGEHVKIVGEKRTEREGLWYRIEVPSRVPLYAHSKWLKRIGPASMASLPAATKRSRGASVVETREDKVFRALEPEVRAELKRAKQTSDVEPLKRAVSQIDSRQLSIEHREARVALLADLLDKERTFTILELQVKEDEVNEELQRRLEEIDRRYQKRLAEIRDQFERTKKPRYITSGIVAWNPDILGRYPSYRIVEGDKMRNYLIATHFDLQRFVGKRVGVVGIADPESGTGYNTVMVKRLEILGDK